MIVCGFVREKMYRRYYQNGNDAYRLTYYMTRPDDYDSDCNSNNYLNAKFFKVWFLNMSYSQFCF